MIAFLLLFPLTLFTAETSPTFLKLMSFNFPTTEVDTLTEIGQDLHLIKDKNEARMKSAKSIIKKYDPDIIGFQETHKEDVDTFQKGKHISNLYDHYAPTIGKDAKDKNAVFFKKDLFSTIGKGIIYLNEEQKEDVNSWDDAHKRACTWLSLQHKFKKTIFFIYNAHLGLKTTSSRKGATLIAEIADKSTAQQVCSFIIGDFNTTSSELNFLTKDPYNFIDIRRSTPPKCIYGPAYTYTGFKDDATEETLDHMFGTLPYAFKPVEYTTISDTSHNTRPSDHYPIMATLQLLL